jgi:hypothetical protein
MPEDLKSKRETGISPSAKVKMPSSDNFAMTSILTLTSIKIEKPSISLPNAQHLSIDLYRKKP